MLAAILFDLDGTIANTDPIHYQAWREMLAVYGMEIDEHFYKTRISGKTNAQIIEEIIPQLSPEESIKFADDKEAMFRQRAENMQPMPGLTELIAWTETHHIKRALVTNAPKLNAIFMLEVLGLKETFELVVLGEECVLGKPDPTPYRIALEKLEITAEKAIALEDSPSGISSAVGAGIRTIGITSTHDPNILRGKGAFMAIPDFTDLQLWTLLNSHLEADLVNT